MSNFAWDRDSNSLSSNTILNTHEDRAGWLWIGAAKELDRYDRENDIWNHYPLDHIQEILEDSAGVLWVGSMAGLFRCEQGEIDELKRVMSDRTYAIMENSEGNLWVGTDRGLIVFVFGTGYYQKFASNSSALYRIGTSALILAVVVLIYKNYLVKTYWR